MKDEEEENATDNPCLSSEAQSIELEFIKTYERLPVLWDVKHPDYTHKYRRGIATDTLLKILKKWDNSATRLTVRQKINILRSCYRKDLRKHLASKTIGPDGEEIYQFTPTSWKFYALKFLGGKVDEDVEHIKNSNIVEIDLDNTNFEEEEVVDISRGDGTSSEITDVLQTFSEDKSRKTSNANKERKKRMKVEVQEYFVDEGLFDREFDAIGANVTCKLKRMNPNQRYHAELLINKVLIEGLKNNLSEDTDLTEVYK